jgi:hypothetical protein
VSLKNDLDLVVRGADGTFYAGNNIRYSSETNQKIAVHDEVNNKV